LTCGCGRIGRRDDAFVHNKEAFMSTFVKSATALALAGALTAGAASQADARSWKPWAAAGAGFVAGAAVGSALAAPRYGYYGPGYASYAYAPGYAPAYDAYAYAPPATVAVPARPTGEFGHYELGHRGCATDGNYNQTDYSNC
jgi:hypothetical protein